MLTKTGENGKRRKEERELEEEKEGRHLHSGVQGRKKARRRGKCTIKY